MAELLTPPQKEQPTPTPKPVPPVDGAVIDPPQPEEPALPELSFWRQPWVQDVLPFATSLAIHVGLIVLGFATYKAAEKIVRVVKEQIVVPDSAVVAGQDVGGIPNPGMGPDTDRPAAQSVDTSVSESKGLSESKTNLNSTLMNAPGGGQGDDASGDIIGQGGGSGKGRSGVGGPGDGGGGGGGGALAEFGTPGGGGGIGPKGRVFGHGGNAMNIVYICDASGSMMLKMDLLKVELDKSVQQLMPIQAFDVMFYQDSNPKHYTSLDSDLDVANADNKKKLYTFLQDIVGQGTTHAIPALTAAFQMQTKPDLIYLLTDGAFEDEGGAAVMDAISKLNADKKVHVNTVLLLGKNIDPGELKDATATMQKIADKNGGTFVSVRVDDL